MKTRTISSIIVLIILVPFLLIGGIPFQFAVLGLSVLGLKEFIDIRQAKKKVPLFIQFISYVLITLFIFSELENTATIYAIDFRLLAGLFISVLFPVVLYHDSEIYSVEDAFYLVGGIFFLGSSFHLFVLLRNIHLSLVVYLLLISTMTDIYAYFTGMLIGKNKLIESVSPKKTLEGLIGGTFFGTFIPTYFYMTVINPAISISAIIIVTFFLSLIGQFGDLFFSSIKRHYKKKDFSNIMPGHGGILDRFDSLIFIVLGFMFFINII